VVADDRRFGLLVLSRRISHFFTLAYMPFGPSVDPQSGRGELLSRLAAALRPHLPRNTLLARFDLPWEKGGEEPNASARGVSKSRDDIQPAATIIVDLTPSLEGILSAMKPKTRYNVRLAAKRGVQVSEASEADVDSWYGLYRETSTRDGIAIHSKGYYTDLLRLPGTYSGVSPVVKLLLARSGGELLAGNIVLFWKTSAVYLTGASSNVKRNLMPTYALQWEAIRMAKEAGCTSYDLYGVPPRADPDHPMYGLYQFKTGFADGLFERWGTWDVSYLPARAAVYTAAERVRMFFFRTLRKRRLRRSRRPRGSEEMP
jgi:lipid II:glycine glycyltransferase (peptidoglycan interpeptide bridge formation enzyme)